MPTTQTPAEPGMKTTPRRVEIRVPGARSIGANQIAAIERRHREIGTVLAQVTVPTVAKALSECIAAQAECAKLHRKAIAKTEARTRIVSEPTRAVAVKAAEESARGRRFATAADRTKAVAAETERQIARYRAELAEQIGKEFANEATPIAARCVSTLKAADVAIKRAELADALTGSDEAPDPQRVEAVRLRLRSLGEYAAAERAFALLHSAIELDDPESYAIVRDAGLPMAIDAVDAGPAKVAMTKDRRGQREGSATKTVATWRKFIAIVRQRDEEQSASTPLGIAQECRRQLGGTFRLLAGDNPADPEVCDAAEFRRRFLDRPFKLDELAVDADASGPRWIKRYVNRREPVRLLDWEGLPPEIMARFNPPKAGAEVRAG